MPQARPHIDHPPPNALLLAMEMRAPWEFGALFPAWLALQRAPRGDGHPVIVFPGLSASDGSTAPLRSYLRHLGYNPSGWNQGFNFGPRAGVLRSAREQLEEAVAETGRKASLIGWSLGGIYARELAKQMPGLVRSVVTLGTPFAGSHTSTNAWKLYALASGRDIERETSDYDLLHLLSHRRRRVLEGQRATTQCGQPAHGEHRGGGQPCGTRAQSQHLVGAGGSARTARGQLAGLPAQARPARHHLPRPAALRRPPGW